MASKHKSSKWNKVKNYAVPFSIAYLIIFLFVLRKSFEFSAVYKAAFLTFLFLFSPLWAMAKVWHAIIIVFLLCVALYFVERLKNPLLKRLIIFPVLLLWLLYGVYCINLLTGGA